MHTPPCEGIQVLCKYIRVKGRRQNMGAGRGRRGGTDASVQECHGSNGGAQWMHADCRGAQWMLIVEELNGDGNTPMSPDPYAIYP